MTTDKPEIVDLTSWDEIADRLPWKTIILIYIATSGPWSLGAFAVSKFDARFAIAIGGVLVPIVIILVQRRAQASEKAQYEAAERYIEQARSAGARRVDVALSCNAAAKVAAKYSGNGTVSSEASAGNKVNVKIEFC